MVFENLLLWAWTVSREAYEITFEDASLWQDPFWFPLELRTAMLFIPEARLVTNLRPIFQFILRYSFEYIFVDQ